MKEDKFLFGIVAGIIALIVLALVVFFARQNQAVTYLEDSTPESITHDYILAVYEGDYKKAYEFLADGENKPVLGKFKYDLSSQKISFDQTSIQIEEVVETEDIATVYLLVNTGGGGRAFEGYTNQDSAQLIKENGTWKIHRMVYPFWGWDWYQPVVK
jgi:hypothetical protein